MKEKFRNSAIDLTDLAIGILILGVTVGIGARLLIAYRDNRLTDLSSFQTNNETMTLNDTPQILTKTGYIGGWGRSILSVQNASDDAGTVPDTNYTTVIDSVYDGNVRIYAAAAEAADSYNTSDVNVTYLSWNTSEAQFSLPNDASIGIAEFGNWFDIIVIVGIAGLILALILMAFGRRGETTGVAY